MFPRLILAGLLVVLSAASAPAQITWSVEQATSSATSVIGDPEDYLIGGLPWDVDGTDDCPPSGPDDVRCEWLTDHIMGDMNHRLNGVAAAIFTPSATPEMVSLISDNWSDLDNSGQSWRVNYDVHFICADPNDLFKMRVRMEFDHAGTNWLTLNLIGDAGTEHVQFRVAPTHTWNEIPETGTQWIVRLLLQRDDPGGDAMVWLDNLSVTEGGSTHVDESFPFDPSAVDGAAALDPIHHLLVSPNPLRDEADVLFRLRQSGRTTVRAYDPSGRLLRTLLRAELGPGPHRLRWDGRDDAGRRAGNGIYLIRIEAPRGALATKVIKLR